MTLARSSLVVLIVLCCAGATHGSVRYWTPYEKGAGTVGLWPMDGTVDEIAGGIAEVVLRGKVSWVEGRFGKALSITSDDGAVVGKLARALEPSRNDDGNLSMEAWVYLEKAPEVQAFIVQLHAPEVKYDRRHKVDDAWKGYVLAVNPDRSVTLGYLTAGNRVMGRKVVRVSTPEGAVPTGRWVHVAAAVKGMAKRIFIDGVPRLSIDYTNTSPETMVMELPKGTPVTVGNSAAGGHRFAGLLDEVRITTDHLYWFKKPETPWAKPDTPARQNFPDMLPGGTWLAYSNSFDDGTAEGVRGNGLTVKGQQLKVPFDPAGGTVEFCFRPGTWDNVNGNRKKSVTLVDWAFRIQATRTGVRAYRYWRGDKVSPFSFASERGGPFVPGAWHHVLVTWRPTGHDRYRIKVYLDGSTDTVYRQYRLEHVARRPVFDVTMKLEKTDEFKLAMPDGTLDELVVYRRPLNHTEARNAWLRYTDAEAMQPTAPVLVDTWDFPGLGQVHYRAEVFNGKGLLAGMDGPMKAMPLSGHVDFDRFPGRFVLRAKPADSGADSVETVPVVRRKAPWHNFRGGISDDVLPGFQPLQQARGVVSGYRKQVTFGGCGMMGSIRVFDTELLAGPVRLKGASGGKAFTVMPKFARPKIIESTPARVHLEGASAAAPIACRMDTLMEYDGCIRFELTMQPAAGQSVKLDELYLEIPMRREVATHMHVCGQPMRSAFYAGRIPSGPGAVWEPYEHSPRTWRFNSDPKPGDGVVWTSTDLVNARRSPVGSLTTPFVWLGNYDMGLTWFADSDRGWWPTDARPALELVRDGKVVKLRVNFAGQPVELSDKRTIVWGLFVNPGKKLTYPERPSGWNFAYHQVSGRFTKPSPRGVEFARIYPDDPEKCRAYVAALHARDLDATPYIESSPMDFFAEDWDYYRNEWSGDGSVHGAQSAVDYAIYWLDRWQKDCAIDGVYIDNTFVRLGFNPVSKSAWRLPDGRIQGGFDLWNQRQYYRRLRTTLIANRGRSHIELHMTACMIPPCFIWADTMLAGEISGVSGKTADFMDYWPLDQIGVLWNGRLWGVPVRSLKKIFDVGYKDRAALEKAFRTRTAAMMLVGATDAVTDHRLRKFGPVYHYEKRLPGIWDDPQAFIPFWEDDVLTSSTDNVYTAGWRYKDKLLVIVSNYRREPVKATVEVNTVDGLKKVAPLVKVRDLENPDTELTWQRGRLSLTVPARDYRFVLFE